MTAQGTASRLSFRQVGESDIWTLWEWRNQPRTREVSFVDSELPNADHETWFAHRYPTLRDRLIMLEWDGRAVGWYQITDWDPVGRTGGWSFVLGDTNGTTGVGALLPLMGLAHGFDRMHALALSGQVLDSNVTVKSLFARFGIPVTSTSSPPSERENGELVPITDYAVTDQQWPGILDTAIRSLPKSLAQLLALSLKSPIREA